MRTPVLTNKQIQALYHVAQGADVYDYETAKALREIEKKFPDLIEIGKPQMYTGSSSEVRPYFGAIATKLGRGLLMKYTKAKLETA